MNKAIKYSIATILVIGSAAATIVAAPHALASDSVQKADKTTAYFLPVHSASCPLRWLCR
jgi:hypothetical protein